MCVVLDTPHHAVISILLLNISSLTLNCWQTLINSSNFLDDGGTKDMEESVALLVAQKKCKKKLYFIGAKPAHRIQRLPSNFQALIQTWY